MPHRIHTSIAPHQPNKMQRTISLLHCLVLLLLAQTCHSLTPPTVRVCRNKHCSKKAPHLLETVTDLLAPASATVESCGCLSQCEKGPNAVLELPDKTVLLHDLSDAAKVMVQWELATENTVMTPIAKLLGAAAKVMERVQATPDPVEQERLLNSVISKLEESHSKSAALAHAYALRAKARLDQERWNEATNDAQNVVLGKLRQVASDASLSLSYRVWADAEEKLGQNADGNKERVIAVLQHWQKAQPSYRSKLQREMQELLEEA